MEKKSRKPESDRQENCNKWPLLWTGYNCVCLSNASRISDGDFLPWLSINIRNHLQIIRLTKKNTKIEIENQKCRTKRCKSMHERWIRAFTIDKPHTRLYNHWFIIYDLFDKFWHEFRDKNGKMAYHIRFVFFFFQTIHENCFCDRRSNVEASGRFRHRCQYRALKWLKLSAFLTWNQFWWVMHDK